MATACWAGLLAAICWPAYVSWFLDEREWREAGFTEQRIPLAPDSGGITGCCTFSPLSPLSLASEPSLFCSHFELAKGIHTHFFLALFNISHHLSLFSLNV
ncbi:hypothetical protein MTR_1g042260 [Medicago truncatula]|uniref:Transmembrane protein n=1 Tax=Medicago truncatula TaxID=3880 RepID=G7I3R3_MEDTR|nr:hypothetical protein MTR_1g042260 [Medicago truncatula]